MPNVIAEDIHHASQDQLLRWWRGEEEVSTPLSSSQVCDEIAWALLKQGGEGRDELTEFLASCEVDSADLTPADVDRAAAAIRFASSPLLPRNEQLVQSATRGAGAPHSRIRMASLATLMEFGWFTLDQAFVDKALLGNGKHAAFAALVRAYEARRLTAKGNGEEKFALLNAMKSDNSFAREHACDEIAHQHLTHMMDYLSMLTHDESPSVKEAARHGLETIQMRQEAPRYFKRG